MINTIIYAFFALAALGVYLWHFKNSDITIGLIKGFVVGCNISNYKQDEASTNYLDMYLGLVAISFVWDE